MTDSGETEADRQYTRREWLTRYAIMNGSSVMMAKEAVSSTALSHPEWDMDGETQDDGRLGDHGRPSVVPEMGDVRVWSGTGWITMTARAGDTRLVDGTLTTSLDPETVGLPPALRWNPSDVVTADRTRTT